MLYTELDIDRLHHNHVVISMGYPRVRGQGITTAYLEMLFGEAELGAIHNFYVYVGHSFRHSQEVEKMFRQGLNERNIEPDQTEMDFLVPWSARPVNTIDVGEKSFMFTSIERLADNDHCLRGIRINRAFLDVDPGLIINDDRFRLKVYKALSTLKIALLPCRGDVI